MNSRHFLAFDLGAESGRAMFAVLDQGTLRLEELHRFANEPVCLPTGLHWDMLSLFREILRGLRLAGARGVPLDGIGIDTWGVDFALLGATGELTENPRHYRDPRNYSAMQKIFDLIPRERIFQETGIQFMQINSLYQLYAAKLAGSPGLKSAETLLFIPDLLNYWLTGVKKAERSIASTSQFYNPATRQWTAALLNDLQLPAGILPGIVDPGTLLGPLIAQGTGLEGTPVFATAGHDTAAAVAAVPATSRDFCYISSGTWSLMGVELDGPLVNQQSLAHNFTNEAGVGNTIRMLKNIAGLWLLQECRRDWALQGSEYSYEELTRMAEAAAPYSGYIDPDAFINPGHMPDQIRRWCEANGQPVPVEHAGMARAIFHSLAHRYCQVLDVLELLTGRHIPVIHIVGGGSRNRFLNQLVADAAGRPVIAGPVEATAIGNVLVQAMGAGALSGLAAARELVRNSFPVETFLPAQGATVN
ncbi:MAG TPA: rhamnulokinase family protein [Bryobacteraceae bacterium]|nr:rhamnulokinase family protein [Bryobacteraceae bacterium]